MNYDSSYNPCDCYDQNDKIQRLQKALVIATLEKTSYRLKLKKQEMLITAGLRYITEKLNNLTQEQNELHNELEEINQGEPTHSMSTILEQHEIIDTEHCFLGQNDHIGECLEDIYKQISQISDMQIRLIDRYKVELQDMAGEVKSMRVSEAEQLLENQMIMSSQRDDFQELYKEEKEKLLELELKFNGLQGDFNEIQSILQEYQEELLQSKQKREEMERKLKDKEQELNEMKRVDKVKQSEDNKVKYQLKESEKRENKLERDLENLREVKENMSRIMETRGKELADLKKELLELRSQNEQLNQQIDQVNQRNKTCESAITALQQSNKMLNAQMQSYKSSLDAQLNNDGQIKESIQQLNLQIESVKQQLQAAQDQIVLKDKAVEKQTKLAKKSQAEALMYLEFKDSQISALEEQLRVAQNEQIKNKGNNGNYQQNNIDNKENQNNNTNSTYNQHIEEIKDLNNLLLVLSKDLRSKELIIQSLQGQVHQQDDGDRFKEGLLVVEQKQQQSSSTTMTKSKQRTLSQEFSSTLPVESLQKQHKSNIKSDSKANSTILGFPPAPKQSSKIAQQPQSKKQSLNNSFSSFSAY